MSDSPLIPETQPIENKNTPKTDISTKRVYVLYDSKTKSLMNAFDNPFKANNFIKKLVKEDLKNLIDNLRLSINISEEDDEEDFKLNTERISTLKTLVQQYKVYDLSRNQSYIYNGKVINRYMIWNLVLNEEIDESQYYNLF